MKSKTRAFIREVEAAGGRVEPSADGHVKVYNVAGAFVAKVRAHARGGDGSRLDRAVKGRILRAVAESAGKAGADREREGR